MTEFEKMRSQLLTNFSDSTIAESIDKAQKLLQKFNAMTSSDSEYRVVLQQLIPNIPESSLIQPPFHCDHGSGIRLGTNVFINYNCTFLDGAYITIGNHVKIGPNVQIYTPNHPIDYEERRKPQETSFPVTIGDDVWIGGNVTILPGVTIGPRTVIGAGSVVTHDIPSDSVAVGNPCKVV
jgi:maltose O-acetyltransferase